MSSTRSTRSPKRGLVIVMCSAITSSPRIVPPSAVYECVERIASGSSKIRERTSPTRRPPRATQMIWLNSKSDSWTVSASRSTSRLYSSQLTYKSTFSRLIKWVMNQYGLGAIGAGGNHGDRHAGKRLDPLQVGACIGGQGSE